jgi:SAM-dependent methyltransferase
MDSCCKICQNSKNNKVYFGREMMFGFRDVFPYFECSVCGCLQLQEHPIDLSKYYPPYYYSYARIVLTPDISIKRSLWRTWINYALTGRGVAGLLMNTIKPAPMLYRLLKKHGINVNARVLDVGCGSGQFLITMYRAGFRHLLGIDPFLPDDIFYSDELHLHKKELHDVKGEFDLITLNHTFEHMEEPLSVLCSLHSLLSNRGLVIIRIPVLGFAWRYYGVNWVQMDPPRHFYLHTARSFEMIAQKAGFQLADTIYDSNEFQFCGSEQYARNIPLLDAATSWSTPTASVTAKKDIKRFTMKADELNRRMDGDQASFYLIKRT